MRSIATCGIYHDTRRAKKDNTYPIKLRVTHERVPRMFKTRFSLTKEDYNKSYGAKTPKGIYIRLNKELREIEGYGREIINGMEQFSFATFEREFYNERQAPNDVIFYYQRLIKEYKESEQVSTKNNYKAALKLLLSILFKMEFDSKVDIATANIRKIPFDFFTHKKLEYFEREAEKRGKSITTISIYLKSLRRVFRLAIKEGAIVEDIFPFGNTSDDDKYVIKETINNKRGLSWDEIGLLENYTPEAASSRERGIDFWFLTFYLRGTNMIDILKIKGKDLSDDKVEFIRSKTRRSRRVITKMVITLTPKALDIIKKYGNVNAADDEYVFPVLEKGDSITLIKKKVGNFTRSVNQAMKKIAIEVGINKPCSTMVARHSWASLAADKKVNIYELMESMGHSKLTTTQNYLKSLGKTNIDNIMFGEEQE